MRAPRGFRQFGSGTNLKEWSLSSPSRACSGQAILASWCRPSSAVIVNAAVSNQLTTGLLRSRRYRLMKVFLRITEEPRLEVRAQRALMDALKRACVGLLHQIL